MKVAISSYPLKSGHKDRGVGVYTRNLIDSLKKAGVEVLEFEDMEEVKDVDLIHYTWFDLYFKTLKVSSTYPTVITIHDVMPLIFKKHFPAGIKGKINLFFQKKNLKKVKKIITVSEASKKDIVKNLKINPEKIAVTSEAIDPQYKPWLKRDQAKFRKKLGLPDKFILYVGDANYVKNLPFLIKGFKEIKEEIKDAKLILVGKVFLKNPTELNHPELKSLKEALGLIKEFGLSEDVICPGYVETKDLVGLYNCATLYVQPSLYEGFGIPILEAMSTGAPVVSSNGGSLPEVGGDAATYFDPKNLEEFKEKLISILQNASLQDKLRNEGLERAKQFSWGKVADETIKVYNQAITNTGV